jgi:DNA-binding Lrp family transcriptional regulator
MDDVDRQLLNAIQGAVPLVPRPFAAIGAGQGLSEDEVLARLAALSAAGVLRQVSAIFDTARLGYRSTLVAAVVAPDRLDAAAAVIGGHPGVSHNYERASAWNLWFTLAVPPDSRLGLEATAARLAAAAGCERYRLLPALQVFKIGVRLDMEEGGTPGAQTGATTARSGEHPGVPVLDRTERTVVTLLQEAFPLVPEPYAALAAGSGLGVDELLRRGRELLARGVIRRVAGLLHHRRAGYVGNVMGVWAVAEPEIDAVGPLIAGFRAVSHCYRRPTYPDWPYSLFSMIHGRSREECLATIEAIAETTGVAERAALWTVREFKKVRLRYFTPEYADWERAA